MNKITHNLMTCFLTITIIFGVSGQIIKVFPYNQSESMTTCTKGLIANLDTLKLKGEVEIKENSSLTSYISLQKYLKSNNTLVLLCLLSIDYDQSENNCSYKVTERKNVYSFFISLAALEELSEGKIIGSLTYTNSTEVSHEISLPKIYTIDPVTLATLTINGEKAKPDCNITVFSRVLEIEASCQTPLRPCYMTLVFNETEILNENDKHTRFEKRFEESTSISVVLKAKVCSKEIKENIFECKIRIELDSFESKFAADSTGIITGVITGIILISVCVICSILFKTGKIKCKSSNEAPSSAEKTQEPLLSGREPAQDRVVQEMSPKNVTQNNNDVTAQVPVESFEKVYCIIDTEQASLASVEKKISDDVRKQTFENDAADGSMENEISENVPMSLTDENYTDSIQINNLLPDSLEEDCVDV